MKTKKLDKKILITTVIIVLLAVICLAMVIAPKFTSHENDLYAYIEYNGIVLREINLTNAENEEFEIVVHDNHKVKFKVENNAIRFIESDCPDKICVNTGWLSSDNDIAACIPNGVLLYVSTKE